MHPIASKAPHLNSSKNYIADASGSLDKINYVIMMKSIDDIKCEFFCEQEKSIGDPNIPVYDIISEIITEKAIFLEKSSPLKIALLLENQFIDDHKIIITSLHGLSSGAMLYILIIRAQIIDNNTKRK